MTSGAGDWSDDSFQGLLLRYRGRAGLTQLQLSARVGVHSRSVQDWESGGSYPSADRLQALIVAFLDTGALRSGHEIAEAEGLWNAALRTAPRLRTRFEHAWFGDLVASRVPALTRSDVAHSALAPEFASPASFATRNQDWGEAPDVLEFQGRQQELGTLHDWLNLERCRVVALVGMGGVGKTTLAARISRELAPSCDLVFWRSLRNAPPVTDWLRAAIALLSNQREVLPESESAGLLLLLGFLRERRCLLVLDNFETVLEPNRSESTYRDGYAGFGQLLQLAAESSHQSHVLVTSREMPPDLELQAGGGMRGLELHGLGIAEARALLADKQLRGDVQAWSNLVDRYDGNGLYFQSSRLASADLLRAGSFRWPMVPGLT